MDRDVLDQNELVFHSYFIRVVSRPWVACVPGFRTIAVDPRTIWLGGLSPNARHATLSAVPKTESYVQRGGMCSALKTDAKGVRYPSGNEKAMTIRSTVQSDVKRYSEYLRDASSPKNVVVAYHSWCKPQQMYVFPFFSPPPRKATCWPRELS